MLAAFIKTVYEKWSGYYCERYLKLVAGRILILAMLNK
jgi:hypothetical protein